MVLPGDRGGDKRELLFNGYRVSAGKDKKVLKLDAQECESI